MTALDEIQGGEKYLIVTKADANGNKYVVVPSAAVIQIVMSIQES